MRVGDEIAVDDAGPGLARGGADIGIVELGADDRSDSVEVEREGAEQGLSLVDPADAFIEDPRRLPAYSRAVGEGDDERAVQRPYFVAQEPTLT